MKNTFARRAFLRTFAGSTFASTAMRFFMRNAEAASHPLRFLFVFTQHGRDAESRCTGTGAGFGLGPAMSVLEPFKKKLLIVDGLRIPDHVREEHPDGRCAMLTASAAGRDVARAISIDRFLAERLSGGRSVYTGIEPPATGTGELNLPISWHGAGAPNTSFIRGADALRKALFTGAMPSKPAPSQPSEDLAAADEAALNDYLQAELARLEKVAPAAQMEKLTLHLKALQQIRADRTDATGAAPVALRTCDADAATGGGHETDRISLLLANAMACGLVRVAVHSFGAYEPHHEVSHWEDASTHRELQRIDRDFSQRFATLLGYLDSFQEGEGTLLDNTIVVWSSEVSGLHGTGVHDTTGMPFVLAGGRSAGLKNGQRLLLSGRNNGELYRAIATRMSVTDVSGYGDPTFVKRPLDDILA